MLDAIEEANKVKLEGVFRNIDFNSEGNLGKTKDRNRRLKILLEDFNKPQLDLSPSRVSEDVIDNTYIYLIERFATDAGKKAGEFYTPHKVSELVAKLAGPAPGDRICDPACGSGGLLIEAAREVGDRNFALFGMESNGSTWALARMNMFLHGADSARIEWCDTLTSPALVENDRLMKFNVVVANPPFSLDKWGAEEAESDRYNRFWRGVPPKSKGDWAFISHMVEAALEKEGRISVVVPHGVLFRGGAEARIRGKLLDDGHIDTVIGLPANLFYSTGIPVCILVLKKCKKPDDVLIINAAEHFEKGKRQNYLNPEHIKKIVDTYQHRKEEERYARRVTMQEIVENDYNLNISRYVSTAKPEPQIDLSATHKQLVEIEKEIRESTAKHNAFLKELGLSPLPTQATENRE